jgi:hypothetical protein
MRYRSPKIAKEQRPVKTVESRSTRKLAVEAGSVAVGLAGIALSLYELQRRKGSRPQMLLDERAATYRDAMYLKSAAVILGGPTLLTAAAIQSVTGLNPDQVQMSISFLKEQGVIVSGIMVTGSGEKVQHLVSSRDFLQAVCDEPDKYDAIVQYAGEYYSDFSVEALKDTFYSELAAFPDTEPDIDF